MPGDGVPQSRPHFRRLLAACSAAGDLEGVDGAYRRLRAAGFAPDAATFRLLFDAVAHWAELDGALAWLCAGGAA